MKNTRNTKNTKNMFILLLISIVIILTSNQAFALNTPIVKSVIIQKGTTANEKYIEVTLNVNDPENYIVCTKLSDLELGYISDKKVFGGVVQNKSDKEIQSSIVAVKRVSSFSTIIISRGTYTGEVKNGKANGYGKVIYKDGSGWFEGYWINDEPNGYGVGEKSDVKLKGNFVNGFLNGVGEISIKDKDKNNISSIGHFEKGKKEGDFLITSKNNKGLISYKDDIEQGNAYVLDNNGNMGKVLYKDGNIVKENNVQNTNNNQNTMSSSNKSNNENNVIDKLETAKDIENYLNKNYGEIKTTIGNTKFTYKVFKNDSKIFEFDFDIGTNYDIKFFWDALNKVDVSSADKEKVKMELMNFQEKLAKDIISKLPNKKINGGYKKSWYKYEYIKQDLISRDYNTWKNYNDVDYLNDLSNYEQTKAGEFRWTPNYDSKL